jgi:hypothetical protein
VVATGALEEALLEKALTNPVGKICVFTGERSKDSDPVCVLHEQQGGHHRSQEKRGQIPPGLPAVIYLSICQRIVCGQILPGWERRREWSQPAFGSRHSPLLLVTVP